MDGNFGCLTAILSRVNVKNYSIACTDFKNPYFVYPFFVSVGMYGYSSYLYGDDMWNSSDVNATNSTLEIISTSKPHLEGTN